MERSSASLAARLLIVVSCATVFSTVVAAQRPSMYQVATTFLGALTPEQRQLASLPFESSERQRWGFETTEVFPRRGLPIGQLSEPQRNLFDALLRTALSERGHQMVTAIMANSYVSFFGTPSPDGTWAWRFEGRNLSLNFTMVKGSLVASTPSFFAGILELEKDSAWTLLKTLDDRQRAITVIASEPPPGIVSGNQPVVAPLPEAGVAATALNDGQRELLMQVIRAHTSTMTFEIATARMARLRAGGLDRITFAWAGSTEPGGPHYYRLRGPHFLIEYVNGPGDTAASVWRDIERDFGRELLR